jgi:hypothetical protein
MDLGDVHQVRTDQGFVRRHKAVLRTGPLLALEAGKLQRGPEWADYELVGLALIAINAIIAHSVLAQGAPVAEVRADLRDAILAVTPDADSARVDAVTDAVLGMLLNERDRRSEVRVDYSDWSGEEYVLRWFPFWMVKQHERPDGTQAFEISEETVNLYLNAFDLDLADHQAFIEGLTRSQLARGRIDKATAAAEQALLVSRAYALSIDRLITATQRDVRRVDWLEAAPAELDEALTHLDERREEETTIIGMAEERLEQVRDAAVRRSLARLIDLIGQCRLTGMALHRRIMEARPTFIREQDRQVLARLRPVCLVSPETDLLPAALSLRSQTADPFAAFTRLLLGPRPRPVLDLAAAVRALGRPCRLHVTPPCPPANPPLRPVEANTARFTEAEKAAAARLLASIQAPTRLRDLLEQAAADGQNVMLLVALHALTAMELPGLVRGPVLARPVGERFDAGWLWGDDLDVVPNPSGHTSTSTISPLAALLVPVAAPTSEQEPDDAA